MTTIHNIATSIVCSLFYFYYFALFPLPFLILLLLSFHFSFVFLRDQRAGGRGFVLPVGRELAGGPVVPGQPVDAALDEDEAELAVLVLPVDLQVLPHLHGFLDEHVQILGNFRSQAVGLQDADDFLTRDRLDLGDAVGIAQDDSDLGRIQPLLGQLAHVVFDVGGRYLQPRRRRALVRQGATGDSLTGSVHTTHGGRIFGFEAFRFL